MLVSRAGYDAAITAKPDDVRAAVTVARRLLDPDMERRVERTLQLLWWVGGGAPEEFPISLLDDMELNPSDTRDFLRNVFADEQVIEDREFWSRLADRLSFDTLVDVGDFTQSANLHQLMSQLAGRLELSHVSPRQARSPIPDVQSTGVAIGRAVPRPPWPRVGMPLHAARQPVLTAQRRRAACSSRRGRPTERRLHSRGGKDRRGCPKGRPQSQGR